MGVCILEHVYNLIAIQKKALEVSCALLEA